MRFLRSLRWASWCVLGILAVTVVAEPRSAFEIVGEYSLPAKASLAFDLRLGSDPSVLLAVPDQGVIEARKMPPGEASTVKLPGGMAPTEKIRTPMLLGVSDTFIATASLLKYVAWAPRANLTKVERISFEVVLDLDLHGDQLLVLGVRRGSDSALAPDGGILWLGSLSKGLSDLRPIFYSADGPGAASFNDCFPAKTGAVRFLADGSFLVIPGVEPGILHFSASGKLLRTWAEEKAGLAGRCTMNEKDGLALARSGSAQLQWINQRRVVEEILPLQEAPGIVVRERRGGMTRWQLGLLRADGRIDLEDLPLSTERSDARMRGDAHEGQILLLMQDLHTPTKADAVPARLFALHRQE
jgi:hypothetical protein